MNMHNLFPVPIGMFDLDRELTEEEEDNLADFRERKREEKAAAARESVKEWS